MRKERVFVVTLIALVVIFVSCGSKHEGTEKPNPMRVRSEVVRLSSDARKRSYVGIVEEESSISVAFTGSGTLARVYVDEGQTVSKGQLIAEIDKTQAQSLLVAAEAQMTQANDAYRRMKQLYENQSLPDMEWVEIQSKVQQAEASLDMARKTLADCSVYAPEDGVVGNGLMSVGEVVLPALPVAEILVIDKVKVRASIPEKEIAAIASSTPSRVTLGAMPGQVFEGEEIEKCVEANNTTHTYDIKIKVRNSHHHLLPGMVARVELMPQADTEVLTVPVTAVRKNAWGQLYVWTIKEGKAHQTVVVVGQPTGNRIVVEGGLQQGDTVITEGYQKLSEGMEVVG